MVTNFVMRGAWTLTLSPDIVLLFGNSSILTLAIGSIEIIRRGIWNLLRVEKEHLANCGTFRAIPDTTDISNKLMNIDVMDTFTTVLVQRKKTESVAINSKAL